MMATTIAVAGASVVTAAFYGGKRAGGALAATEAVVLASRFRKAVAMRRVWSGEKAGLTTNSASAEHGTLEVVCPSYGRTGTMSMKAALEILGFGPCYHMDHVFKLHIKDHPQLWLDGFQGRGLALYKILDGYKSEILAANPNAKVVVTQRDADAWWKSMYATIHREGPCWEGWGLLFLEVLFTDICVANHMTLHIKTLSMGEEEAKADYTRHNAEVLAHVNPDKLLKFSAKDGWEPLCEFLGVPVPDEPFPRVNSAKHIANGFRGYNIIGWVLMATTVTVAGASVAAVSFLGGKRAGGALAATEAVLLASRFHKAAAMRRTMAGSTSTSAAAEHGTLQVVCPSYGRTGTKSMQTALRILGFDPCYHMSKVWEHHKDRHAELWLDALQGRGLAANEIFRGYKAVADFPAAPFYKEILAANPDAKVVVTVRDADDWWRSFRSTINFNNPLRVGWGYFFLEVLISDVRIFKHMLRHIRTLEMDEEEAKADYARHNKEVLEHVGADKLLQFSVKDGWEPLCEFLGVPVPDEPFPKVNSTQEINKMHRSVNVKGWLMMAATLTVAGASVAAASFFGGKRAGGALAATEATVLACRVRKATIMRRVETGRKKS
eukprot:g16233.t1